MEVELHAFLTSAIDGAEFSFTPRPLYPRGKSPWYPLVRRVAWPQSRSGSDGEDKEYS